MGWIKRFNWFHDKRHPRAMGQAEVERFLSVLVTQRGVSAVQSPMGALFGGGAGRRAAA